MFKSYEFYSLLVDTEAFALTLMEDQLRLGEAMNADIDYDKLLATHVLLNVQHEQNQKILRRLTKIKKMKDWFTNLFKR